MRLNDLVINGIYEDNHRVLWKYKGHYNNFQTGELHHKFQRISNGELLEFSHIEIILFISIIRFHKLPPVPTPAPRVPVNNNVSLVVNDVYKHKVTNDLWKYKGFTKDPIRHYNIHRFEYAGNSNVPSPLIYNDKALPNFLKDLEPVKQKDKFNIGDYVYLNPRLINNPNIVNDKTKYKGFLHAPLEINDIVCPNVQLKSNGGKTLIVDKCLLMTRIEFAWCIDSLEEDKNKDVIDDSDHYVKAETVNGKDVMDMTRNLIRR